MTYKMMALARLMCPRSNIPSTSALATINLANGREKGLQRGANVMMPNLTPAAYRAHYEIYPAKACIRETAEQCHGCMRMRITSIGRQPGTGPGASPNMLERTRVSGRLPTQRSA
jgi:biotin synthase